MSLTRYAARSSIIAFALAMVVPLAGCSADAPQLPGLTLDDGCVEIASACDAGDDCPVEPRCRARKAIPSRYFPPACSEGETRSCKIILGEHEGVTDCILGTQPCVDGEWSDACTPDEGGAT
jgi:hypothetical protein